MDIGNLIYSLPVPPNVGRQEQLDKLNEMIQKFGMTETARRFAWLHDATVEEAQALIEKFISGEYIDDNGDKGGVSFYGDL